MYVVSILLMFRPDMGYFGVRCGWSKKDVWEGQEVAKGWRVGERVRGAGG